MRRPQSDADVLVACVLGAAGAVVSFALLQSITTGLAGTVVGRLTPPDTIGRLWVFFVLVPALLVLAGIGLPCLLRIVRSLARGSLSGVDALSPATVAAGAGLVIAEAAAGRSGTVSLGLVCALCVWRLHPHARRIHEMLNGPLLLATSAALLGFGVYHQRLEAGEAASVAVAPTLFLASFYATLAGGVAGLAGGMTERAGGVTRASVSLLWLLGYAAWIGGVDRWGAASTYAVGALVGALAAWSRAASTRRVDESRAIL